MIPAVLEKVTSRKAFAEFCDLPLRLHPQDRYVPLARGVLHDWWTGKGPHARYGPVEFFLIRDRDGVAAGRTVLHRNPKFDAKLGATHQLFGLTEFVDDDEIARALFRHVAQRGADCEVLFGPVALLPNQTGGVITFGYDERGFLDSAWNPPYYPDTYERHGFTRRFEADTWLCDDFTGEPFDFDDARLTAEGLRIRYAAKRDFAAQLEILRSMLNASFAQLGYYTEIDADELAAQTDGLAYLIDESLLLWLERKGEPVAFIVTVPDVSQFLIRARGDLGTLNSVRLLLTRKRYRRDAVLVIKGTVPAAQGQGYLTLLSRELHRNLRSHGYRSLRSTYVERGNAASAAQYRRAGGRPLHGYTFYSRPS